MKPCTLNIKVEHKYSKNEVLEMNLPNKIKNSLNNDWDNTVLYHDLYTKLFKLNIDNNGIGNINDITKKMKQNFIKTFKIVSKTNYIYLKASVLLDIGLFYYFDKQYEEAGEYLLQAAECGAEAFGFNLENAKDFVFPTLHYMSFEYAPWYIGKLVNTAQIKLGSPLFFRMINWINNVCIHSNSLNWRVIGYYNRGTFFEIFENNIEESKKMFLMGSKISDEDLIDCKLIPPEPESYSFKAKKNCFIYINKRIR